MPITVSLVTAKGGGFRATAHTGAPFRIVVPVSVMNGTIDGGATTVTIPTGSEESEPFTVIRTSGTTDDVTVDIGMLSGLPPDNDGYALVKFGNLPLQAREQDLGICGRTEQVRTAILERIDGISACALVTKAHLGAISGALNLRDTGIASLAAGDFAGLSSLDELNLTFNNLSTLPAGVFLGLSSLTKLWLGENELGSLPAGTFSGLSSLRWLFLHDSELSDLPEGVFSGLSSLTVLWLNENQLIGLPEGAFSGLPSLKELYLHDNELVSLPEGVFFGAAVTSATRAGRQ